MKKCFVVVLLLLVIGMACSHLLVGISAVSCWVEQSRSCLWLFHTWAVVEAACSVSYLGYWTCPWRQTDDLDSDESFLLLVKTLIESSVHYLIFAILSPYDQVNSQICRFLSSWLCRFCLLPCLYQLSLNIRQNKQTKTPSKTDKTQLSVILERFSRKLFSAR